MLPSEASVESLPRDVIAAVAATLGPGSVLVVPVVGAMLLPVLVPCQPPCRCQPPCWCQARASRGLRCWGAYGARRRSAPTSAWWLLRFAADPGGSRARRRAAVAAADPAAGRATRAALWLLWRRTLGGTAPPLPALWRLLLRRRTLGGTACPAVVVAAAALGGPRAPLWRLLLRRRRGRLRSSPTLSLLLRWRSSAVLALRMGGRRRADERQKRGQPYRPPMPARSQTFASVHDST